MAAAGLGADDLRVAADHAVIARQCSLLKIPSDAVKQPLPLDTTDRRTELMSQLLRSQGSDLERFSAKLSAASGTQEGNVVIGSAASGLGKTHLAYSWGSQNGFSIISRAITSDLDASIAPPFAWLLVQLRCLKAVPPGNAVAVSAAAFLFVRLTLLSFVHFSVLALRAIRASHPRAPAGMQRQLLLRMHRNGNADALVTTILDFLLLHMRVKAFCLDGNDVYALDAEIMRAYEVSLSFAVRDVMGTDVLVTVDEAHELLERRECKSIASLFLAQRPDGSGACGGDVSLSVPQSDNETASRSLFYAVVLQLSSLQSTHRWGVYVTGTALSMANIAYSASASVATRCHAEEFAPAHRMSVADIVNVLSSYWNFVEVLSDTTVLLHLGHFVGRPQLFVQGVFKPLLSMICVKFRLPTAPELVAALVDSFARSVEVRKKYFIEKLTANFPVARDGSGTQALIPLLFKAVVMDNGFITLRDSDHLAAAICTGLLAVSSTQTKTGAVNMRDEPVIFEALRAAMLDTMQEGRVLDVLIRSSQPKEVFEKGGALEIATSWHVALMCNRITNPTLAALLSTLGVSDAVIPPDLDSWVVRATRVHDDVLGRGHLGAGDHTPFRRYFFNADGGIDDSRIVFDTPLDLGGDIAFLVSRVKPVPPVDTGGSDVFGGRQFKLVVMQCRNVIDATVAETLLTLHPGTQYLNNLARNHLLGLTRDRVVRATQSGTSWKRWNALTFDDGKSFLTRNWLRIAVVARALDNAIPAFSLAAATENVTDSHVRAWTATQRRLAALSPIVWVSLAAPFARCSGGFPESVRKALVAVADETTAAIVAARASTASAAPPQLSRMMLLHHELWIPTSVSDAARLVTQVEGEGTRIPAGSKRKRN